MRWFILAAIFAAACGESRTTCVIPANIPSADLPSASDAGAGCGFTSSVEVCDQENDGTQKCTNQCTDSEYGLSCSGSMTADDSLKCKVVPLPTPLGVTIYCCPCAH